MKKEKICKSCHQVREERYLCDTCGGDLFAVYYGVPFTLDCRTDLDETQYHFCSFTCILKFIVEELKKTQPKETRFEYGKENNNVKS